jgi:hypothetical protein
MSKWKVEASAVVGLRFDVEAENEDESYKRAWDLVKQVRGNMKGGISIPTGVILAWPCIDELVWGDTEIEEGG